MFQPLQLNQANFDRFAAGASIISSAAIAAALGVNPAVIPNGSAAAPGLALANSSTTGLYRYSADILGIAAEGLQHTAFQYQNVNGTNDGALTRKGRPQTHSAGAAYAYPVTEFIETQTIQGGRPIVMYDIGLGDLHVADTTAITSYCYTTELDKTDVYADAGAVSFSGGFGGVVVRVPIAASADVTFANAVGIDFTIPNSADVLGTHTSTKLIRLPTSAGGAASTYYGIWQEQTYNGATIASAEDADIKITAGASGTASADIILNARNASSFVDIMTTDRLLARFSTVGASLNNIEFSANNTPLIRARHATGANNVALALSSQGTSPVDIMTAAGTLTQFRVLHMASAANFPVVTGAASGANPRIGASAENLILGTGTTRATNATSGYLLQSASNGTPTGTPTNVGGAGMIVVAADYAGKVLHVYNGATSSWETGWTLA